MIRSARHALRQNWRPPLAAGICTKWHSVGSRTFVSREGPASWAIWAPAVAGAGLCLATVGASCEEPKVVPDSGSEVRVLTYNVLSPPLCTASGFPKCSAEAVSPPKRLEKLLERLDLATKDGVVIGLQEVDLSWAGKLHAFFAERDYCAVFAQYGNKFSGYMGVMLVWPRSKYEVLDVEISRLSDTAPEGTWLKEKGGAKTLNPSGYLTTQGLREVLGCFPPAKTAESTPGAFEWRLAQARHNEVIYARLRSRTKGSKSFCVATYHMPCLFGEPEKVRVVNIHTYLLLSRLKAFSKGDAAVLLGDFNFKPGSSSYEIAASGGSLEAALSAPNGIAETFGLKRLLAKVPFEGGLGSAYRQFHGQEPLFTNFAQSAGHSEPFVDTLDYIWFTPGQLSVVDCPALPASREEVAGPFPNEREPSDHLPLSATFRLAA
mmetsp:Transcript_65414/g.142613  ORF Transcript_65414/g.142613 Transcript_65414/m.142613 type:complete len:434 (-) Transcript_65414:55-1356(-)